MYVEHTFDIFFAKPHKIWINMFMCTFPKVLKMYIIVKINYNVRSLNKALQIC